MGSDRSSRLLPSGSGTRPYQKVASPYRRARSGHEPVRPAQRAGPGGTLHDDQRPRRQPAVLGQQRGGPASPRRRPARTAGRRTPRHTWSLGRARGPAPVPPGRRTTAAPGSPIASMFCLMTRAARRAVTRPAARAPRPGTGPRGRPRPIPRTSPGPALRPAVPRSRRWWRTGLPWRDRSSAWCLRPSGTASRRPPASPAITRATPLVCTPQPQPLYLAPGNRRFPWSQAPWTPAPADVGQAAQRRPREQSGPSRRLTTAPLRTVTMNPWC